MVALPVFVGLRDLSDPAHAPPEDVASWMSEPESLRLATMRNALRRAQFIQGRWLGRQILATAFGGDAARDWRLSAGLAGPPQVLGGAAESGIHISVSHSAHHVCCAVSRAAIGVDIEQTSRQRDWPAIAELVFTLEERRQLEALTSDQRAEYFYAVWTLKEAWVKSLSGSMAPDVLAQLQTCRVRESQHQHQANATLWHAADFAMALVAPVQSVIAWMGPTPIDILQSNLWRVGPR
jgi:phosphopantetheine--protein transferase-like protein